MVQFSEALRARIESMSPDELAATEVRRQSREADRRQLAVLDALWEPATVAPGTAARAVNTKAATRAVTIKIGGTNGADHLKISEGSSFHETIILGPTVYRLIAGGAVDPATLKRNPMRFVVNPGGAGYDRVTVDRAALAAIVAQERSLEMGRATGLVALEKATATPTHQALERQIALFEERWAVEAISAKIGTAASRVASRAVLLIAGKDHVALWVRREDLTPGPGRIVGSSLAAAIVRPDHLRAINGIGNKPAAPADRAAHYLQNTFGSGPERRLVLDVASLRKKLPLLTVDEQNQALALFDRMIERSATIGQERAVRLMTGARLGEARTGRLKRVMR